MDRSLPSDMGQGRLLLRRFFLGVGVVLFVAGTAMLTIGLIGYFDESVALAPDSESTAAGSTPRFRDIIPRPPDGIEDIEGLPVAIPYYNPTTDPPAEVATTVRMVVESIGVDAPVVEMGLDPDGIPQVPLNGADVAWYDFSTKPGEGSNAVFAGHINWQGKSGVFGDLIKVEPGDTVRLTSEEGREYVYEVTANFPVDPEDPASLKVMRPTDEDTITLITCGGTWIPDPDARFGGNYTDRTIVQGKLVKSGLVTPPVPTAISGG